MAQDLHSIACAKYINTHILVNGIQCLSISTLLRVMNKTVNSLHILCIFVLNVHLLSSGKINVNIFGLHLREITPVLKGKDL